MTSNTDGCHGLGAFGTVKYDTLSGISLPYVLQSKIIWHQDVGSYFRPSVQNFIKRAPQDQKLYHMEYFNHTTSGIRPSFGAPSFWNREKKHGIFNLSLI